MTDARALIAQIGRFGIVGLAATAVHALVYWLLVQFAATEANLANLLAFLTAFAVSWIGHSRWTFGAGGRQRLARFTGVALGGYALNALATWIIVDGLVMDPRWPLVFILFVTPAATFAAGRLWAFR
ncbi:MAG: GtrA family protein [Minwuia sp.]|uniref:GtrA family protein n=1 Tax=Minwuia sp. TaxID=2493630 RepID=UPI003A8B92D7